MGQKVIVKSLNKPNWAGMHRYQKCHDHIVAKSTKGGYKTGLSEEDQRRLEKKLGLKEGELSPYSEYWKEFAVTITNRDLILDLDNARDELELSILKENIRVANSINERHKWPKAEYVIHDAEEEAANENAKIDEEARAMSDFVGLTPQECRNYLKLLGKGVTSMSDAVVKNTLFKIAKNDYQAFNRITDMPNYKTQVLVYDLIEKGEVKIKGGHYFFDEVQLGHGLDSACAYLDDHHNQELRLLLMGKLKPQEAKKAPRGRKPKTEE
jgi:hypothetical protein